MAGFFGSKTSDACCAGFAAGCGAAVTVGAVVGAIGGAAVGIWVCVDYIQPALAAVDGISPVGASWITAAIALCGLLEATAAAGAGAGALSLGSLCCFAECCVGAACCCADLDALSANNDSAVSNSV